MEGSYADDENYKATSLSNPLSNPGPFVSADKEMRNRIKQGPRQIAADVPAPRAPATNTLATWLRSPVSGDRTLLFEKFKEPAVDIDDSFFLPWTEKYNLEQEQSMFGGHRDMLREAIEDGHYENLQEDMYEIIAGSMALPPNVRISLSLPETCRAWKDVWPLESKLPQIREEFGFIRRLQKWDYEDILQLQYGLMVGETATPAFRASDAEVSLARREMYLEDKSDDEIVEAIVQMKLRVWEQREFHRVRANMGDRTDTEAPVA